MTILDEILNAQKRGESKGITSICSAHPKVLAAAFAHGQTHNGALLVESTCNQVNQFGGYTGMVPERFVHSLHQVAKRVGYPQERLILGGDHLGPAVWKAEPIKSAMAKGKALIRDYVCAGYLKIHLDASMKLGGDPAGPLAFEVSARRTAELARVAEDAYHQRGFGEAPRYVIGTEVPVPGGAAAVEDHLQVTRVSDLEKTLHTTQQAFYDLDLHRAWERVIALVVQPGVEFGHDFIHDYNPAATAALSGFIENKSLVYEAHSTDYQTPAALRRMVVDHFAILKVGPALTFALREAVFALAMMESVLVPEVEQSHLVERLDEVMVADPTHWRKYYQGDPAQQRFARLYSFSDRCRYYWSHPTLQAAFKRLLKNLHTYPLPISLVSQYLPEQYRRIRAGRLEKDPEAIIEDKIIAVLEGYQQATTERNYDGFTNPP